MKKRISPYAVIIMRLIKCTVTCFLISALLLSVTSSDVAAEEVPQTVRVGIYYELPNKDTRVFSSSNTSESGFKIGYSENNRFNELFELDEKMIVLAPSGNLHTDNIDNRILCVGVSEINTFGGYHLQQNQSYSTYSDASIKALAIQNAFVAFSEGVYVVRIGAYNSIEEVSAVCEQYADCRILSPSVGGITLCDTSQNKILFEYDNADRKFALRSKDGGTVTLPDSNNNYYSYHGFFEYYVSNNLLNMVNTLPLEQYVKSVMANEIGTTASKEVTKAFSVLVRTIPLCSKHSKYGFDVCNDSCCQVYRGTYKENSEINAIVDSTKGMILTYNGNPITCLYNYSNGGASCSSYAAWGSSALPYLDSVFLEEPAALAVTWQKIFTEKELFDYLVSRNMYSTLRAGIEKVEILATDPQGSSYVTEFAVTDIYGNTVTVYNAATIRGSLDFYSVNFTIDYVFNTEAVTCSGYAEMNVSTVITADGIQKFGSLGETNNIITSAGLIEPVTANYIVFNGKGKGHGVGYSQVGAEALVLQGYDYTYTLAFYFPGSIIKIIYE